MLRLDIYYNDPAVLIYETTVPLQLNAMQPFRVFARWRSLSVNECGHGEIQRETTPNGQKLSSISIAASSQCKSTSSRDQSWKSQPSMTGIFEVNDNNEAIFNAAVAPILPQVLQGKPSNFFAYGHSRSGKTHTIIGYDYETTKRARSLSSFYPSSNARARSSERKRWQRPIRYWDSHV